MESQINSVEVPIFWPSLEQFANFGNFIKWLEAQDLSFAKVIPPPEWEPKSKIIPGEFMLENVYSQRHDKLQHGGYEIINTKLDPMTYSHYVQLATANECEINEDKFWENVASKSSSNLYAIDNDISLFGDDVSLWNLSKLTKTHSNIHGTNTTMNIAEGIQRPFSYFAVGSSCFGAHIEDGNLNSINILHRGAPKLWYFIRQDQNKKFEQLTKKMSKNIDCDLYVRHKTILPSPSVLDAQKIGFSRVLQNAGEIIISFSGGYHFGFSLGTNEAESVNFGSERWLRFLMTSKYAHAPTREMNNTLTSDGSPESSMISVRSFPVRYVKPIMIRSLH
ncbi:probable lysine-specific demethylase 4A [Sitodiplosis mosellana]|uniref:probable lysine-specific demethylase 4A n=1 Tax=Sitodiplosis mosellana TaxID=263140 RepID=UPI0024440709|nr:probable lysine-specific demethylase 4A [Sitodiplosis mosellana]